MDRRLRVNRLLMVLVVLLLMQACL